MNQIYECGVKKNNILGMAQTPHPPTHRTGNNILPNYLYRYKKNTMLIRNVLKHFRILTVIIPPGQSYLQVLLNHQ